MHDYVIEATKDGVHFTFKAGFNAGDPSRFDGEPFNADVAVKEAKLFALKRGREYMGVRLIINLPTIQTGKSKVHGI